MLDYHEIRSMFRYDPNTGVLIRVWRKTWKGNVVYHGKPITSSTKNGYSQVNINKRPYATHRVIFVYMTGKEPPCDVDHINGDRSDNRWSNLRLVDRAENLKNTGLRPTNTSGVIGISFDKSKRKWHAYINSAPNVRLNLGYHTTKDSAIAARKAAEKVYAYHENHGARPSWQG